MFSCDLAADTNTTCHLLALLLHQTITVLSPCRNQAAVPSAWSLGHPSCVKAGSGQQTSPSWDTVPAPAEGVTHCAHPAASPTHPPSPCCTLQQLFPSPLYILKNCESIALYTPYCLLWMPITISLEAAQKTHTEKCEWIRDASWFEKILSTKWFSYEAEQHLTTENPDLKLSGSNSTTPPNQGTELALVQPCPRGSTEPCI